LAERMIEEASLAIEEDGAQAIIGYGGLSVIRALREVLSVSVTSPLAAGILFAEMLVRARLS
jgi:Asp/Glu/hydantoin racemase